MYSTKNTIPDKTRNLLIPVMQDRLADSIDLMLQAKQAHWNVKGHDFIALHELFDKIHEDVKEYVDVIAERIVQFGGTAEGSIHMAVKRTQFQEHAVSGFSGKDQIESLSRSLALYGESARKTIDQATEVKDAATADIFTEIVRGVDKWLWFVEAHHQGK